MPWQWWPPALVAAAAVALQVGAALPAVPAWVLVTLAAPATVAGLWWLGRLRIRVVDGQLAVDDARLPVECVSAAVPLDGDGRRELLGPSADPLAFVVQRPWVRGAVQVLLDDPADPTPYWLISSRDPERLAATLTRAGHPAPADQPHG